MISEAAVKIYDHAQDKEVILPCHRHADAFRILHDLGYEREDFTEIEQGFLTGEGIFLGRVDAFKHAQACGQISQNLFVTKLFSEDLW